MEFGPAIRSYGRFPIKMMGYQCRFLSPNRFHAHVSPVSPRNLHQFTSFGVRFLHFCQANDLVLFSLPKPIDLTPLEAARRPHRDLERQILSKTNKLNLHECAFGQQYQPRVHQSNLPQLPGLMASESSHRYFLSTKQQPKLDLLNHVLRQAELGNESCQI